MSIWCTHDHIGTDPTLSKRRQGGRVLSYADGWSNHYPDLTGQAETPAAITLATIPAWCVPGHRDEDDDRLGPWVRLDVDAPAARTFWREDDTGGATAPVYASVVLDEEAARSLIAQLTGWLDTPKARPLPGSDTTERTGQ